MAAIRSLRFGQGAVLPRERAEVEVPAIAARPKATRSAYEKTGRC